ncbi:AMP-binding protein [candidate division CSSED10-310 bacterium]|uniref:AMP-binding protein n=1 Tax=candidate division CSSED10-310 bacterium TaxID=2855610 RepID=A0ABV6Z1A3_UNCC1
MLNLSSLLDQNCSEHPENIALRFLPSEIITYQQLFESVQAFTTGLRKCGFREGDRIALSLGNTPEFIYAYFAIMRAGMVVVPLNVMLQKYELEYQLADTGAVCLITNRRFARIFKEIPPTATEVKKVIVAQREMGQHTTWDGIELDSRQNAEIAPTERDTLAQITYTAAMDGYPNGAMLTHGNLSSNRSMNIKAMGTCETDRYLSAIPLFHTYGAMTNCLAPLAVGGSVFLQARFNPKDFLLAMKDHSITVINGVPTLFASLLGHESFDPSYFQSVRLMIAGGAALPLPIFKKYAAAGLEIKQGYGLTECSPAVSVNPLHGLNKPESIGIALEDVQLKVVDPQGKEKQVLEEGELLVKGPLTMKGYWNNQELTAKTLHDGWVHTGDLVKVDEEGYIFITGRLKDMIITGGFNVYPKEVVRLLSSHPKIEHVSIVGVPDLVHGELVKAIIKLKPNETLSEREFSHDAKKVMAIYKVPRLIEIQSQ